MTVSAEKSSIPLTDSLVIQSILIGAGAASYARLAAVADAS
jgi:hypothetical protein